LPEDGAKMKVVEKLTARGHENILATHRSTFEITKDAHLTRRGDCVVAVAADKGVRDLSDELKRALRKTSSKLMIVLQAGQEREVVEASGNPKLTLSHPIDIVVRRSSFVCNRTLAVKANKVAEDFSREFVKQLRNPQQRVDITLVAEASDAVTAQE
jgi:hypothetical protein